MNCSADPHQTIKLPIGGTAITPATAAYRLEHGLSPRSEMRYELGGMLLISTVICQ